MQQANKTIEKNIFIAKQLIIDNKNMSHTGETYKKVKYVRCDGPNCLCGNCSGCFHSSCLVEMADGTNKSVEFIKSGDYVKTPNGIAKVLVKVQSQQQNDPSPKVQTTHQQTQQQNSQQNFIQSPYSYQQQYQQQQQQQQQQQLTQQKKSLPNEKVETQPQPQIEKRIDPLPKDIKLQSYPSLNEAPTKSTQ